MEFMDETERMVEALGMTWAEYDAMMSEAAGSGQQITDTY